jgi:hypothetical protein
VLARLLACLQPKLNQKKNQKMLSQKKNHQCTDLQQSLALKKLTPPLPFCKVLFPLLSILCSVSTSTSRSVTARLSFSSVLSFWPNSITDDFGQFCFSSLYQPSMPGVQ